MQIGTFMLHLAVFKVNLNRGTLIHMAASQPTRKRRDLGQATKLVRKTAPAQRPPHNTVRMTYPMQGRRRDGHRLLSLTRSAA